MQIPIGRYNVIQKDSSKIVEYLFYLYVASMIILSQMEVGNIISKSLGLILIFSFFVINVGLLKKKIIYFQELNYFFFFFVFVLLSAINVVNQDLYTDRFLTLVQLFVFYIIGYAIIVHNNIKFDSIFKVVIFSSVIVFIQGFLMKSSSALSTETRLISGEGNPNVLAYNGIFSFIFSLYFIKKADSKGKTFMYCILGLFFLYAILETQSRQALISIVFIFISYVGLEMIRKYPLAKSKSWFIIKILIVLLLIFALVSVAFYIIINSNYFERFQSLYLFLKLQSGNDTSQMFNKAMDYSTFERRELIKNGIKMWFDYPFLGTGLDNYRVRLSEYWISARSAYAHNNYVELLATIGIFGAISYYFIFKSIIKKIFLNFKKNIGSNSIMLKRKIFLILLFTILLLDMVNVSYSEKYFWLLILLANSFANRDMSLQNTRVQNV